MKKSWACRHPILSIFILLLISIFLVVPALKYSGMCLSEGRWLSSEEKIRLAAEAIASNMPNINYIDEYMRRFLPPSETDFRNFEVEYSRYYDPKIWEKGKLGYGRRTSIDVDEFLEKNPQCCRIVDRVISPNSVYQDYADVVEVRYTANFLDKSRKIVELKDYTEYPTIKNCGEVDTSRH